MRKILSALMIFAMFTFLFGCGDGEKFDLDLTKMSSTMVYANVYDMMSEPEKYIGKNIKMSGDFAVYHDEVTDNYYFACIIADATACCSQGVEFELAGEHRYPEDYPEIGDKITVSGIFETYTEGEYLYCRIADAVLKR